VVLALQSGHRESTASWSKLRRDLKQRGRTPSKADPWNARPEGADEGRRLILLTHLLTVPLRKPPKPQAWVVPQDKTMLGSPAVDLPERPDQPGRLRRALEALQRALLENSRVYWLLTALMVLLSAVVVLLHFPINHDVAAHLDYVGRVLDGERLYVDIVEINPPLIFYLYFPPVLVARWLGVLDIPCTQWFVTLTAVGLALLLYRVMSRVNVPAEPGARRCLLWVVLQLYLPFSVADFGQREHLMLMLIAPYLFAVPAVGRVPLSGPLALLVGGLAGLGFSLKPHFALLWVLAETYLFLVRKERRAFLRPENLILCGVAVAYVVWVVLGTEYLSNLKIVLEVYESFDNPLSYVIAQSEPLLLGATGAALLLVRPPEALRGLRAVLTLALLALIFVAVIQAKGWSYHWLPAQSVAWLALAVLSLELAAREDLRACLRLPPHLTPLVLVLVLLGMAAMRAEAKARSPDTAEAPFIRALTEAVAEYGRGQGTAYFSTDCYPGFPVMRYAETTTVLRANFWVLPGLYAETPKLLQPFPYRAPQQMSELEREFLRSVGEDLARKRPTVILVDRRLHKQGFGPTTFDFIDYFSRDPRVRSELEKYRRKQELGPFLVLVRKDARGPDTPIPRL
jgi:hypothetical protein